MERRIRSVRQGFPAARVIVRRLYRFRLVRDGEKILRQVAPPAPSPDGGIANSGGDKRCLKQPWGLIRWSTPFHFASPIREHLRCRGSRPVAGFGVALLARARSLACWKEEIDLSALPRAARTIRRRGLAQFNKAINRSHPNPTYYVE